MLEATAPVATSLVSSVAAHQKAQSVGATVRQWQCVRATLASREPLTSIFQIIISLPAKTWSGLRWPEKYRQAGWLKLVEEIQENVLVK